MLIVSFGAGLGNQMFEYAFYQQLKSLHPDKEIKIDSKYAFPLAHNGIEVLRIFDLNVDFASLEDVISLTHGFFLAGEGFNGNHLMKRVLKKLGLYPRTMKIQKDFSAFYPEFLDKDIGDDFYFLGVFANYHYFKDDSKKIKSIFTFPEIKDKTNSDYLEQIQGCNSVSIHIRRGDYISLGIQTASNRFYEEAIDYIDSKVDNAKFFIFTDDKNYARSQFTSERFVIVEGNSGENSFRDMQLMSLCRHNIIANSTFSFWGAYLNANEDKIVVAPDLPFTGTSYPFVCDDWKLI